MGPSCSDGKVEGDAVNTIFYRWTVGGGGNDDADRSVGYRAHLWDARTVWKAEAVGWKVIVY